MVGHTGQRVYFADLTHTAMGVNAKAFPLGVGVVAAYARHCLGCQIQVEIFKYPDLLNLALQRQRPRMLCMSHNCCNANLSYAFAEYAKKQWPDIIVVFGGPNFPTSQSGRRAYLKARPAIDFCIKWDGELSFVQLFQQLSFYDWEVEKLKQDHILWDNGCYLWGQDYWEGADHKLPAFDSQVSAYTSGLLDEFFAYPLNPLIETTRGCPYSCTYCNDGHPFKTKGIRKPPKMVQAELEYIAQRVNPAAELWLCDNNFGMYQEDVETSRIIQWVMSQYQWPYAVMASNGKSHPERILQTRQIINTGRLGAMRLGSSLQSTDPVVLKHIKRKNLSLDRLLELGRIRKNAVAAHTPLFTELILALPGDSMASHYESLRYAIDDINVSNIDIHQLSLISGAEMADGDERERYQLQSRFRVFVNCAGFYTLGAQEIGCAEIDEMVVANQTMTFNEYLECRLLDLLVKIYIDYDPFQEVLGLLRYMKLSVFEWLMTLKEDYWCCYENLNRLAQKFIHESQCGLFSTREDLLRFIEDKDNIRKYVSGELGGNELLNNKAIAMLEYNHELHQALRESALAYIEKKGLLTPVVNEYVHEAVAYSQLRKLAMGDLHDVKVGEFHYDFIRAAEHGFMVDPEAFQCETLRIEFYYDDATLAYIKTRLDCYGGKDIGQIGKLLQKTNLQLMNRKARRAYGEVG